MSKSPPPGSVMRTLKLSDDDNVPAQVGEAVRRKYRPALIVMSGERVGVRVTVQGNMLVGRDPSAGLMLPDPGVSYRHALLEDRGGTWAVVDLESTNGTLVDNEKAKETELRSGDKIRFGSTIVRFEVQDETDEAYTQIVAQLINIDDLTGLYLRRRFDSEVPVLVAAAEAEGRPFGLLAMDLDGIKGINDKNGHLFGAYTISETGKLIGNVLKGRGIACRFGGDEFIAALPSLDLEETVSVGNEILGLVRSHAYEFEGVPLRPGISIGATATAVSPPDATTLFRHADEALYHAKRTGKNRVCTYLEVTRASG